MTCLEVVVLCDSLAQHFELLRAQLPLAQHLVLDYYLELKLVGGADKAIALQHLSQVLELVLLVGGWAEREAVVLICLTAGILLSTNDDDDVAESCMGAQPAVQALERARYARRIPGIVVRSDFVGIQCNILCLLVLVIRGA